MKRSEIAGACAAIAFMWGAYLLGWLGGIPWWPVGAFSAAVVATVGLRYLFVRLGIVPRDPPPADRLEKILLGIVSVLLAYVLAGIFLAPDPWSPSASGSSAWLSWFGTRPRGFAANAILVITVVLVVHRIRRNRRR